MGPSRRKEAVRALKAHNVSERRACWLVSCPRPTVQYVAKPKDDSALRVELETLAAAHVRWGYRKLHVMVRRKGIVVNHKRLRRIYRAAGLQVRPRKKRHVRYARGLTTTAPTRLNQRWCVDFLHDRLLTRRRIRALHAVDGLSRWNLALEIDHWLNSRRVIRIFDTIAAERGYPSELRVDNGPEFTSLAMLRWAAEHDVELLFIDPGKPIQNAHIESFNSRARDEFFNVHAFRSLAEARSAAAEWRVEYNELRPHSALGNRTPQEFEDQYINCNAPQIQVA